MGVPQAIAAAHGQGCRELIDTVLAGLARPAPAPADDTSAIRVAIIGRPNVGKSTLVNRLLGEERVIASEQPGTTRDSIMVPFQRDGRDFLLVDTAGMRRRSKVEDAVERASVGAHAAGDRRGACRGHGARRARQRRRAGRERARARRWSAAACC